MAEKYNFIQALESMNDIERKFFIAYCKVVQAEAGVSLEEIYDNASAASKYAIFPQWNIAL